MSDFSRTISNKEINEILSKFNFLFTFKYKTELKSDIPLNQLLFCNYNLDDNKEMQYYIKTNKIKVNKFSEYYYNTDHSKNITKFENISMIKQFYDKINSFYHEIVNKKYTITSKQSFCDIFINSSQLSKENKNIPILRFLKDLYILLKQETKISVEQICSELLNRFELNLRGISKKNDHLEDFELHKAVFEKNYRIISNILSDNKEYKNSNIFNDINEVDSNDNTPLMLALKLKNIEAVKILCDYGANVKLKSFDDDISPLDYALKNRVEEALRIFVNSIKKKIYSKWEFNKDEIFNLLSKLPNFQMKFQLNFDSNFLNLFSYFNSFDNYNIYKLNNDIKIETNVKRNDSDMNGKSSFLIQIKNKKIIKYDCNNKTGYDFIENLISDKDEDKKINKLLKEGKINTKIYSNNLSINNTNVITKIEGYNCYFNKIKGEMIIEKEYIQNNKINDIQSNNINNIYPSFNIYFIKGIENKNHLNKNISTEKIKRKIVKQKKELNIDLYMCNKFPISINNFLPLIHILSLNSTDFSQLESSITQKILPLKSFPLKVSFPIGLNIHAQLILRYFSLNPPSEKEFYQKKLINENTNLLDLNSACHTEISSYDFYKNFYKEKNINPNNSEHLDEDINYMTKKIREYPKQYERSSNDNNKYSRKNYKAETNKIDLQKNKFIKVPKNNIFECTNSNIIPISPKVNKKNNDLPQSNRELKKRKTIKCLFQIKINPNNLLNNNNISEERIKSNNINDYFFFNKNIPPQINNTIKNNLQNIIMNQHKKKKNKKINFSNNSNSNSLETTSKEHIKGVCVIY